jgi:hypothetical protein
MNHMIHVAAVTQLRLNGAGRAYYLREREAHKKLGTCPTEGRTMSSSARYWPEPAAHPPAADQLDVQDQVRPGNVAGTPVPPSTSAPSTALGQANQCRAVQAPLSGS